MLENERSEAWRRPRNLVSEPGPQFKLRSTLDPVKKAHRYGSNFHEIVLIGESTRILRIARGMQNPVKLHKVLFRCKMAVGFQICLWIFGRMTSWEVILILVSRGKKKLTPIFLISFAHNRSLRIFFKKNLDLLDPPPPQISFYGNSITTGRISKISSDLSFLSLTTSKKDLVYFWGYTRRVLMGLYYNSGISSQ